MRIYTVLERPAAAGRDPDVVLVKEGFSWPAFLAPPLWALYQRQWLGLVLYVLAVTLLGLFADLAALDPVTESALALGFTVLVGSGANDWRRRTLGRQGYALIGVVAAPDLGIAEARWFLGSAPGAGGAPRVAAPLPPPPVPPATPA
jgi:hypothetical protein